MFTVRHQLVVAVALLLAGCTGGLAPAEAGSGTQAAVASQPTPVTEESPPLDERQSIRATPNGYMELYRQTIDSVVEIRVRSPRGQSQGSGFVYDTNGHIVTNQHVVGRADSVQVRFRNGTWKTARVVGTDVYTDLAVIKVESLPSGVDSLTVTNTAPRPGRPVVALGSPLGYEGTITAGIISGRNRSMQTSRGFSIPDTIQTDAPINPGNSGGPLVTMNGQVIGVNRAKKGDNLGFAISADIVQRVVPTLIREGAYHHSYLGIQTVQVTPRIADANDLTDAQGVMVVDVLNAGPSAKTLEPATLARTEIGGTVPVNGDIIVAVDGRRIRSQHDLAQYLMLETRPNDRISVTVRRGGETVTETIRLGKRPELRSSESV